MSDLYRISQVRAADGGARLLVELTCVREGETQKEILSLLSARLSHLPGIGEISPETVCELRQEAEVCAAVLAGLRALGAFGASPRRLIEKLCAKGHKRDVATLAVAELSEKGFLKEEESAEREAERGLAKLWGDRRILADLRAKGYTSEAIRYAALRLQNEDGAARCVALMRKRRITIPSDAPAMQKLVSSLVRYGYTPQEIKTALQIAKKQ